MIEPNEFEEVLTGIVDMEGRYGYAESIATNVRDFINRELDNGYTIINIDYSRAHYLQTFSNSAGDTHPVYSALITYGKRKLHIKEL